MKKYINILLAATALTTVSCSDSNFEEIISGEEKEKISFSMSDEAGAVTSRAGSRAGFTGETKVVMRIQSNHSQSSDRPVLYTRTTANAKLQQTAAGGFKYSELTFSTENNLTRYWDDCYGRHGILSVYAVAVANKKDDTLLPVNIFKDGTGESSTTNVTSWGNSNDNSITWSVETTEQTKDKIDNQDLVYSNNIKSLGEKGVYKYDFTNSKYIPDLAQSVTGENDFTDGQMQFRLNGTAPASSGKFDKGHLNFKHALSRLTVVIVEGTGFTSGVSSDFQFATNTNITINNVPTSGTLNVETGEWTSSSSNNINKMAPEGTYSDATGTYRAQFLPGYTFADNNTTNVLSFTIDNNVYYINQDMIYEALKANAGTGTEQNGLDAAATSYKMEQGKNYKLTLTVNKTGIDQLTATLEEWKDVKAANENLYNSYVTLNLKTTTGTACTNFDIYRLNDPSSTPLTDQTPTTANQHIAYNWAKSYTDKQTPTSTSTDGVWKTNWYWDSNKDFYHFRTVNKETTINNEGTKSNFPITSGAVASSDYHWGAPMIEGATLKYEETEADETRNGKPCTKEGFSTSISKAIGSTTSAITITELHMMSEIYVTVKTTNDEKKVTLYDSGNSKGTTVTLTKFAKTGTVDMGSGFVRPSTASDQIGDQEITAPSTFFKTNGIETNTFSWAVVPQKLSRGDSDSDYIGITIKTPDNNQYYIVKKLSDIVASSVTTHGSSTEITDPNQAKDAKITKWFPGHHYYYTFTISKKGIEDITCTVANWIDVTGANQNITLED